MVTSTLAPALKLTWGEEGGYVNDPNDPGGPTKYGITHKTLAAHRGVPSVTTAQVKALTLNEATEIYERSYWRQSGADRLPAGIDYAVFDFGINSGPARAVKYLQEIVGVRADGVFGDQTLKAVTTYINSLSPNTLIDKYQDRRLVYLKGLRTWSTYKKGWTNRVARVREHAKRFAAGSNVYAATSMTIQDYQDGGAKARQEDTSVLTVLKKPEAFTPVMASMSGVGAIASGEGPFQYALAIAFVLLVAVGVWYFVRRVRNDA